MDLVPAMDAIYLWAEKPASPLHVIALQLYRPPDDAGADHLDALHTEMLDASRLKRAFRRRPVRSWRTGGQYAWVADEDVDLSLHVRRAALPRPGRIRELLEYVGQWHEVPLARDRPLWEARLVEGLDDGRFALLTKMHHSSFDGVNMGRHLLGGLSPDPAARGVTAPWQQSRDRVAKGRPRRGRPSLRSRVTGAVRAVGGVAASTPRLAGAAVTALTDRSSVPFAAPMTRFNDPVGSARRFAGDSWPVERLGAVARRTGTSRNDVALAMCGGALRAYLDELGELPGASLVAMMPVSLEPTDPARAARDGNSWAAVLCALATEIDDPVTRLRRIHVTTTREKQLMADLDGISATTLSALTMGGAAPISVPGLPRSPRPAFSLVVSNIPAVKHRLYLDGCELTENHPVSMVSDGQALNVTMVSYAGRLAFGISGCAKSVPRLQRLLTGLEDALVDLEKATADL